MGRNIQSLHRNIKNNKHHPQLAIGVVIKIGFIMSCKKEDKNGEKRAVVVAIVRKILGHKIAVGRGGWGGVKIWCHAVQMNLSYHSFIHSISLSATPCAINTLLPS